MYIIQTKILDRYNYFLSELKGKHKSIVYWNGILQNAKKFTDKEEARSWALAETTLETQIIPI